MLPSHYNLTTLMHYKNDNISALYKEIETAVGTVTMTSMDKVVNVQISTPEQSQSFKIDVTPEMKTRLFSQNDVKGIIDALDEKKEDRVKTKKKKTKRKQKTKKSWADWLVARRSLI